MICEANFHAFADADILAVTTSLLMGKSLEPLSGQLPKVREPLLMVAHENLCQKSCSLKCQGVPPSPRVLVIVASLISDRCLQRLLSALSVHRHWWPPHQKLSPILNSESFISVLFSPPPVRKKRP